tara:strand:- start:191 stop:358 length:168 start_codon:yes stop_codon:yes gene_type:complete
MKSYKVIQIVEEAYYIEAENEADAIEQVQSLNCDCEVDEISIRVIELIDIREVGS